MLQSHGMAQDPHKSLFSVEESRHRNFGEKATYSTVDENGELIVNEDLDISLIMLYGYILFMNNSFQYALSK